MAQFCSAQLVNSNLSFSDTKIDLNIDDKRTADIEGVTAIIAYELQRMPTASYEFDMESIVKVIEFLRHRIFCSKKILKGIFIYIFIAGCRC